MIVGGTEGGQPASPLPKSDIVYGQGGSDAFIWAPGDGSDTFVGGNPPAKPKRTPGGPFEGTSRVGRSR